MDTGFFSKRFEKKVSLFSKAHLKDLAKHYVG